MGTNRVGLEADERRWAEHVAEAARLAAEDLRALGDPLHRELLADLDELIARVTAELEADAGYGRHAA
jgi:hypothetical protein